MGWRPQRDSNPTNSHDSASTESVSTLEKQAATAITKSTSQSTVLVAESTLIALPTDPDDALRAAVKAAIDAQDLERASKLIELLKSTPKAAPVIALATMRRER